MRPGNGENAGFCTIFQLAALCSSHLLKIFKCLESTVYIQLPYSNSQDGPRFKLNTLDICALTLA